MNISIFQEKAESLLDQLEDLVNESMLDDGNTCEESQRLCVLKGISEAQRAISGTIQEDLQ